MPNVAHDTDQLISTARERLKQAKDADQHNRDEAEIDILFRVLEQWDESTRDEREASKPQRPCITIDRLGTFCNQVVNGIRRSEPAPRVAPRGDGANKATAEVIEGKVRDILYDSDSQLAFHEAVKYQVCSGMGAFRLDPEVIDAETNQQRLVVSPIYDPSTVWFDPFAKRPDKRDARYAIVIDVMSRIEYKERWPDSEVAMADFTNKAWPDDWMDPLKDGNAVMVAEYWCVETAGSGDAVAYGDDLNANEGRARQRPLAKNGKIVRMHLLNGVEELEPPVERPGDCIPIFCVEGDSFWVRGKRHVLSLIRSARDVQRLYNWEATKEVELLAMQNYAGYLLTPTMIQNHEKMWQDAADKTFPYLLVNPDPQSPNGPIHNSAEAPIQAITQAQAIRAQEIKDVIGLQDPSLGAAQHANQSGFAIHQLRTEGDAATYHYVANLGLTLKHFCKVLVSWLPFYYDTPQTMTIRKADGTQQDVEVNSAQPVRMPNGQSYQHDLTKGNYETVVEIGPSNDTARQEEAGFFQGIVSSVPDAFWIIGDLAIRARDSEGADEAADRVKRAIALKTPGLIQDNDGPPAGVAAQIQGLQGQIQQLTQLVQQQAIEIKTRVIPKQIEAQSRVQTAQIQSRTQIAKAMLDLKAKIHEVSLKHGHAMFDTTLSAANDAIANMMEMLHESELAPGPDQGPQGIHPSAPPQPMGPGGGGSAPAA